MKKTRLRSDPEKTRLWITRSRRPLPKVGKRTLKRQEYNRKLNKLGITECEIKLPGCWKDSHLSWAHSRKSRFLVTEADWLEAARACPQCHHTIEALPHAQMFRLVTEAIARRR